MNQQEQKTELLLQEKDYNEAATEYNKKIKRFPTVIIANMFGFDEVEYFKASESAQNAPEVDFNK